MIYKKQHITWSTHFFPLQFYKAKCILILPINSLGRDALPHSEGSLEDSLPSKFITHSDNHSYIQSQGYSQDMRIGLKKLSVNNHIHQLNVSSIIQWLWPQQPRPLLTWIFKTPEAFCWFCCKRLTHLPVHVRILWISWRKSLWGVGIILLIYTPKTSKACVF